MDNYNNYSNSLLESRREARESIPESVLNRDSIVEVLERRQESIDTINKKYNDLEQSIKNDMEEKEVEFIEKESVLGKDHLQELYEENRKILGLDLLEYDKDLINNNMIDLEEEHFEQIIKLNEHINEFEVSHKYNEFGVRQNEFQVNQLDTEIPNIDLISKFDESIEKLKIKENNNFINNEIPEDRITTIIQNEFNEAVSADMPADIIFIDFINNKQYSLSIINEESEEVGDFHIWLNEEHDEPYYLHDIFDEKTAKQVRESIRDGETIHINNPTNWFDYENPTELFNYMKEEKLSSDLDSKTYLYQDNNNIYINGWNFADINNNEIELSPYDFMSEDSQSIIRDKIYELNTPYTNIALKDIGLDKLENNSNYVITTDNDSNANEKLSSLILSTSAVNIDKELIDGAYDLYSNFSNYYDEKFNIEDNDIIKNHFIERFGNIEEHKEGLEQILRETPEDTNSNVYSIHDDTRKNIGEINLNVPTKIIPVSVREDVERSFNRYKHFSNEEVTTMFNQLNVYEYDSPYINSKSLKKLDETYIETLKGTKSQDFYNGMKEYAKLNSPTFFDDNKQEKRESTLENMSTFQNYLENKNSLKTIINLDRNTISTSDNKVSFHFEDIENEPEKTLNTFSSYSKSINSKIDIDI